VNPDRPKRLSRLQQILYEFIPGLFSVLEGNVFFVGARPRSRADVEALPPDWKSLYLKTKAGLITEADVMFGRDASEDELYTSEVFYSATESFRHDVKLLARWLWQTFAGAAEPAPDLMDHFRNS
jgi:lipopolysaccharide/colanic/teichoic acid biosynthesis glycosyltransferase